MSSSTLRCENGSSIRLSSDKYSTSWVPMIRRCKPRVTLKKTIYINLIMCHLSSASSWTQESSAKKQSSFILKTRCLEADNIASKNRHRPLQDREFTLNCKLAALIDLLLMRLNHIVHCSMWILDRVCKAFILYYFVKLFLSLTGLDAVIQDIMETVQKNDTLQVVN